MIVTHCINLNVYKQINNFVTYQYLKEWNVTENKPNRFKVRQCVTVFYAITSYAEFRISVIPNQRNYTEITQISKPT